MARGLSYTISGTQFNGLSQAVSYGDDCGMATNYPIVQITNVTTGQVVYLRSYNFSRMGVATGTTVPDDVQSCSIDIPVDLGTGLWSLVVIANGIPSLPEMIMIVNLNLTPQEVVATILEGVIQDGGGVVVVGGHILRIPPWDPGYDVLGALAALSLANEIPSPAGQAARAALWAAIGAIAATNSNAEEV
jgi:hypothetical protein